MNKHKHAYCKHKNLMYCPHCNVVFCEDCETEWGQYKYTNPWITTYSIGDYSTDKPLYQGTACNHTDNVFEKIE